MRKDRVVAMTGAAGGIGSALVGRFLSDGDTVIAADVDAEALSQLTKTYKSEWLDAKLIAVKADTATEKGAADFADEAKRATGRVDILVNCAGYFPARAFRDMTYAEWKHVLTVNLDSMFLNTRAMLPLIEGRNWGRIINIGSNSVFKGPPKYTHYVAAKAGVLGFSRALASELSGTGITVNVVAPGLTATAPVLKNMPPEMLASRRQERAIKRDQHAGDLVGAVAFLASPDSDFMTGQVMNVDGGAVYY